MWGHRSESLWPFIACRPRASAHPRMMEYQKPEAHALRPSEINPGLEPGSQGHREDPNRTTRAFLPHWLAWHAVSGSTPSTSLVFFHSPGTFLVVATQRNNNAKAFFLPGWIASVTQSRLMRQIHTRSPIHATICVQAGTQQREQIGRFSVDAAHLLLSGLIYFPRRTEIKVGLLRGVISLSI